MTVRAVEGKKPYTGGTAIEITEDKVINLLLREANNLLQVNGNNELFCDLQLNNELRPTDDFPVGVTTGRIIEDNGWDWEGTILCAKTTSGDNIKLVYTDEGEIWVDNGTGTFKKMYLASEVDTIIENLTTFKPFLDTFVTDGTTQQFMTSVLNSDVKVGDVYLGQVSLSDMPSGITVEAEVEVYVYPSNGVNNILYCIMRSADVSPYLWECNSYQYRGWQSIGGGGGTTYTAGEGINIDSNNEISNTLPGAVVNSTAPSSPSQGDLWYDTTNNVLKSYDGTNWNAIGVESNTKAFYLVGTGSTAEVLEPAQAAYDWYLAGKNPILVSDGLAYSLSHYYSVTNTLGFIAEEGFYRDAGHNYIALSYSSDTVTNVAKQVSMVSNNFLSKYNTTSYTPTADYNPATKKYVDDKQSTISVTLTTNGWSSNTQTVTATGVTSSNTVIVSPAPADMDDYTSNKVKCSAQGTDSLTFTCSSAPSNALTVNVAILN